jgi:flagellar capping protein FliD
MQSENRQKIELLANQVSTIRQISKGIGSHLEEEKELINQLDSGFDKTKVMVGKVFDRMDNLLQQASSNIFCYIILFTCLLIGILCKFT